MASNEFLKAAKSRLAKSWKQSKDKTDPFGNFSGPDGVYTCKLTNVNLGVISNGEYAGTPYISFNFVVLSGEFKGQTPSDFRQLRDFGERYTLADVMDNVVFSLQKMGVDTSDDSFMDVEALVPIAEELSKTKPTVKIKMSTKKDKKGIDRQNMSILGLASSDDGDAPQYEEDMPDDVQPIPTLVGITVNAKWEDGEFYPATIVEDDSLGSYIVQFEDESISTLQEEDVQFPDGTFPESGIDTDEEESSTWEVGATTTYQDKEWTIKEINEDDVTAVLSRPRVPPKRGIPLEDLS